MTGHGSAVARDEQVQVLAEIRSVNNRFLKVIVSSDLDAAHQARLEAMVRARVQRGAVNVRIQIEYGGSDSQYQINLPQLAAYRKQLVESGDTTALLGSLLLLPGVVTESVPGARIEAAWPTIESAMNGALERFVEMRALEGNTMSDDLLSNCDLIAAGAEKVKSLAPNVVDGYARRITERINRMLEEHEVSVRPSDLVREIGLFAERVDISEELVRLSSHIDQFRAVATSPDVSDGRKLEFLTQELLRETNTIGSKANDAAIAGQVVEMKAAIERIREMTQNIE